MGQLFLSEYLHLGRTAQVYLHQESKRYVVKMFEGSSEDSEHFGTEQQAENWAEEWVLQAQ